jgi:hypothetical protein
MLLLTPVTGRNAGRCLFKQNDNLAMTKRKTICKSCLLILAGKFSVIRKVNKLSRYRRAD